MLKTTAKIRTFTDVNKHFFSEKGIPGAISYIEYRHSQVNNAFMNYQDDIQIGTPCMSKYLPRNGFRW